MKEVRYMISDAAKKINVEPHVLRYWEEELEVGIPRNEMGHRYYHEEDIQMMQGVKYLKERGFQLKSIKILLPDVNQVMKLPHRRLLELRDRLELAVSREELRLHRELELRREQEEPGVKVVEGCAGQALTTCEDAELGVQGEAGIKQQQELQGDSEVQVQSEWEPRSEEPQVQQRGGELPQKEQGIGQPQNELMQEQEEGNFCEKDMAGINPELKKDCAGEKITADAVAGGYEEMENITRFDDLASRNISASRKNKSNKKRNRENNKKEWRNGRAQGNETGSQLACEQDMKQGNIQKSSSDIQPANQAAKLVEMWQKEKENSPVVELKEAEIGKEPDGQLVGQAVDSESVQGDGRFTEESDIVWEEGANEDIETQLQERTGVSAANVVYEPEPEKSELSEPQKDSEAGVRVSDHAVRMQQFRGIMNEIVTDAMRENNRELAGSITASVSREMEYHMRKREMMLEEHFKQLDRTLREYQLGQKQAAVARECKGRRESKFFKKNAKVRI